MSTEASSDAAGPPAHFSRDRATWLAYLFSLYYSYALNILGPLTPFLRSELALSYTVASLHFSAFAAGMLLAGVSADRAVARLGRRTTLWIAAAGIALGTVVLMLGHQPAITIAACFLMGSVGSWILAVYPAVLASRHGLLAAIAFAEATILGSAGAAVAPFFLGLFGRTPLGWRAALALPALVLVPLFLIYRSEPLAASRRQERHAQPASRASARRLPGAFWAFWVVLVAVVSIEFCIAFWIPDFLRTERGLTAANAALAGSLFLGAMMIGRLAGSRLLRTVAPKALLLASLALTGVGFLVFWQIGVVAVGAAGIAVAGLGVANLYPTTLSLAVATAPQQIDIATARASLASGVAIIALPLLLGRMADAVGIGPAFGLVGVLTVVAVVVLLLATALVGRGAASSAQAVSAD